MSRKTTAFLLGGGALALSLFLGGCQDDKPRYYLAPMLAYDTQMGKNADGVRPLGNIHLSMPNLMEANTTTIGIGLHYDTAQSSDGYSAMGGWRHTYARHMDAHPHYDALTLKSTQFSTAQEACHDGWEALKTQSFDGSLSDTYASIESSSSLCEVVRDGVTLLQLPVWSDEKPTAYHTLTRADGRTYVFVPDAKHSTTYHAIDGTNVSLFAQNNGTWEFIDLDDTVEHYDAQGRLVRLQQGDAVRTFGYDDEGLLTSIADAFDKRVTLVYDEGKLQSLHNSHSNNVVRFAYENDRLSSMHMAGVTMMQNSYDAQGRLTTLSYPEVNSTMSYEYEGDKASRMTLEGMTTGSATYRYSIGSFTTQDEQSNATQTAYILDRGVLKITQHVTPHQTQKLTYDASGYIQSIDVIEHNSTTLTSVATTRSARATTLATPTTRVRFTRDAQGRQTMGSVTSSDTNFSIVNAYASKWHKPTTIVREESVEHFTYNAQGQVATHTKGTIDAHLSHTIPAARALMHTPASNSTTTTFSYNAQGLLASVTAPNGSVQNFTYDSNGKRIQQSTVASQVRLLRTTGNAATLPNIFDANIKTFLVGGAADDHDDTDPVFNHSGRFYTNANKAFKEWWQIDAVISDGVLPLITALEEYNQDLIIIGHSYGADSAIDFSYYYGVLHHSVEKKLRLLITIDPVGWYVNYRAYTDYWINVRAEPGPFVKYRTVFKTIYILWWPVTIATHELYNEWNGSDYVAAAGGKITYDNIASSAFLDEHITYSGHHNQFECMLEEVAKAHTNIGLFKTTISDTGITSIYNCGISESSTINATKE